MSYSEIAVEKINNCGTSYIVPDLEYVTVTVMQDGKLKIVIDSDKGKHDKTALESQHRDELAAKFKGMQVEGGPEQTTA